MLRWFLVLVLLGRVAHADCDVDPVAEWAVRVGAERVIDRPAGYAPTPNFWTIGGHVELGALWNCDSTRVRVAFTSSLQGDLRRLEYQSYEEPHLEDNLKLSYGGSLEVLVGGPWWIHLGAEKVPDFGYEVGAGFRLRSGTQITGVTGLDVVFTKPECVRCTSPAIGIMATGGLEGRGALPLVGSIAVFALATVLGGALYIASRPM